MNRRRDLTTGEGYLKGGERDLTSGERVL